MAAETVFIVGIGDDGIEGMTAHAVKIVESAHVLLGPDSCRSLLSAGMRERLEIVASLEELVDHIEKSESQNKIVVCWIATNCACLCFKIIFFTNIFPLFYR